MNTIRHAARGRRLTQAVAIASAGLLLAACSNAASDTSSSGDGETSEAQKEAQELIDASSVVPEFTLDAPAFDASKAKGKTILNVPITHAIPYNKAVDAEAKRVAAEYGVKWVDFENNGTPTEWSKGVDYGVQIKADVINLQGGVDPRVIIPALQRAKKAGIPIISTHGYQIGEQIPDEVKDLVDGTVSVPFDKVSALQADYVVANSGCEAKPVIITSNEVPASIGIVKAMKDELARLCPDLEVGEINVPANQWGTGIKPEVQSYLVKNPDTDWIMTNYDGMVVPTVAGIQAAGKSGSVKVTSYNGTPEIVKLIQDGDVFAADMGESIPWLAWAHLDQNLRLLSGVEMIPDGDEKTPIRILDDSNVDEMGTPPQSDKGFGDAYVDGYTKMWSGS